MDAAKTDRAGPRAGSLSTWAMLIKRIYEVDPLKCAKCGGEMEIITLLERDQRSVIEKILSGHQSGADQNKFRCPSVDCGRVQSAPSPIHVGHRPTRNEPRTSLANCSWYSIRSSFRYQLGSRIPPTLSPQAARFAVSLSVREKIREKSDFITNLAYIPGRIARKGSFSWQRGPTWRKPRCPEEFP